MATFDYGRIAAIADRLIEKFGRTDAILRQSADAREGHWDSAPTIAEHTCTAAVVEYEDGEADGTTILRGDRMALVAPGSLPVDPQDDDRFVWVATSYRVMHVERVAPAGAVVLWILQLRK